MTAQSVTYWDAFGIGVPNSTTLFGNANLGYTALTNLHVPGQFGYGGDDTTFIQRWYARHNLGAKIAPRLERFAEDIVATFIVGNRIMWQMPLRDLFFRRPREAQAFHVRDPWFVEIPPRQYVTVQIDRMGPASTELWDAFLTELGVTRDMHLWQSDQPRIWIQFEGIQTSGDDTAQVRREIARRLRAYQSAEENIADYILSLTRTTKDETTIGTLNAVRDAVLEGRARPDAIVDNHIGGASLIVDKDD